MAAVGQRSWWQRNWIWIVPAGCLGLVAALVALVGAVVILVFTGIRSSGVYQEAVQLARDNPRVIDALGAPIEVGLLVSGSIHVSGSSGDAELAIPLHGASNRGTLRVVARREGGRWLFEQAEVEVRGREDPIDLLSVGEPADRKLRKGLRAARAPLGVRAVA